ncbi:sensor histidine kinase [Streptomyces sp. NPDC056519]|uniref:sensor histidine kinase n=1 Tax=Streptomyces sp. NPDC056519 TaxID=3345849 RepID=UPI0036CA2A16
MKIFVPRPDRRWLSWWESRLAYLALDVAVVAACAVPALAAGGSPWRLTAFFVALPTLLVRRRFPWLPVMALPLFCWSWGALPAVVVCYTVARQWGWRRRMLPAFLLAAGGTVASTWDPRPGSGVLYQLLVPPIWLAASALAGLWMRQRHTLLDALRESARRAERERDLLAERAVAAERRRIAREMHDVVAHRVSTIALQAGALSVTARDERTIETAEIIRRVSAQALTELREILDVLRHDQQESSEVEHGAQGGHGMQHGVERAVERGVQSDGSVQADVAALVRDCVEAGGNIHLHPAEELPVVPGAVRRAVHRVAQEALTNAAKHAPYARVDIRLVDEQGELQLTVTNRRGGRRPSEHAVPGSGYGLIGMRERVTLVQGTLHTGPTPDGGYRVHAAIPLVPTVPTAPKEPA